MCAGWCSHAAQSAMRENLLKRRGKKVDTEQNSDEKGCKEEGMINH